MWEAMPGLTPRAAVSLCVPESSFAAFLPPRDLERVPEAHHWLHGAVDSPWALGNAEELMQTVQGCSGHAEEPVLSTVSAFTPFSVPSTMTSKWLTLSHTGLFCPHQSAVASWLPSPKDGW